MTAGPSEESAARKPRPGSETVLLLLSGGIDSTYLLYTYLRDTPHAVHAHHVSLRYPHQERWKVEDRACERIMAWCGRNLREVAYSTSRFELGFSRIGWDSDVQLVAASKVALNLGPGRITVVRGVCAEDLRLPSVREREERDVTRKLWSALRQSVSLVADLGPEVENPIVTRKLSKAQLVAELPTELLELTWSCRKPEPSAHGLHPCGLCHACGLRSAALRGAGKGD